MFVGLVDLQIRGIARSSLSSMCNMIRARFAQGRNRRVCRGVRLKVRVVKVDFDRRQIEFLADNNAGLPEPQGNRQSAMLKKADNLMENLLKPQAGASLGKKRPSPPADATTENNPCPPQRSLRNLGSRKVGKRAASLLSAVVLCVMPARAWLAGLEPATL